MSQSLVQSKTILDHLHECKRENNEKLKQVKNLEDLVKFKLSTVIDKIRETAEGQELKGLEVFQKICDPLLVNQQYSQLTKKANHIGKQDPKKLNYSYTNGMSDTSLPLVSSKQDQQPQHHEKSISIDDQRHNAPKDNKRTQSEKVDPVKFLQQYFKQTQQPNVRKPQFTNYIMEKYEKKFGLSKRSIVSSSSANHSLINNQLNSQSLSHALPSYNVSKMGNYKETSDNLNQSSFIQNFPVTNNGAYGSFGQYQPAPHQQQHSYYSFMNNSKKQFKEDLQDNLNQNPSYAQLLKNPFSQEVQEYNSMNMLNFNKMKSDIKRMFDQDDSHNLSHFQNQEEDQDSYKRHLNFKSMIQDNFLKSKISKVPLGMDSSDNSDRTINMDYDDDKINQQQTSHINPTDKKIQMLLQNKLSKDIQLSYLSNIQQVKAAGLENFQSTLKPEVQQKFRSTQVSQLKTHRKSQDMPELQSLKKRKPVTKDKNSSDIMLFNYNKDIENFQKRVQKRKENKQEHSAKKPRVQKLYNKTNYSQDYIPLNATQNQSLEQLSLINDTQSEVHIEIKDNNIEEPQPDQSDPITISQQLDSSQPETVVPKEDQKKQLGKVSFIQRAPKPKKEKIVHPTTEINLQPPPEMNNDIYVKEPQQPTHVKKSSMSLKRSSKYAATTDGGYLSQQEYMDSVSEDMQNQLMEYAMQKRRAWSPKRFKKFPRFTIFLNKDQDTKEYLKDNIISLNPEFMNYLLNSSDAQKQIEDILELKDPSVLQKLLQDQSVSSDNDNLRESIKLDQESTKSNKAAYKYQDPFDKVLLTKGIDNQILTSFRTLTKTNNTVSDTMKIVHQRFNPLQANNAHIARLKRGHHLYQINEEAFGDDNQPEGDSTLKNTQRESITSDQPDILSLQIRQKQSPIVIKYDYEQQTNSGGIRTNQNSSSKAIVYNQQSLNSNREEQKEIEIFDQQDTIQSKSKQNPFKYDEPTPTDNHYASQEQFLNSNTEKFSTEYIQSLLVQTADSKKAVQKQTTMRTTQNTLQKSALPMQKIDPSDMFGKQRVLKPNNDHSQENQKPIIPVYVDYEQLQQSLGQQSLNIVNQRTQALIAHNSSYTQRKQKLKCAGGFHAYNMPLSKDRGHKLSSQNLPLTTVLTDKRISVSQYRQLRPGQMLSQAEISHLNLSQLDHMELNDKEKQDFTRKLVLPPVNKLKNMIDDLYQKEKKYVKQYLREDYIEKNNFIFDLQKSHQLHTNKEIKRARDKIRTDRQQFLMGDSSKDNMQILNTKYQ